MVSPAVTLGPLMPAVQTALGAQSLQAHLETSGILCLLAWLFSLVFAVSHRRMCALTPAVG